MDQLFSSNANVSLEKQIETCAIKQTKPEDLEYVYDVEKCLDWIKRNNFSKVCLQFPDFLLPDASEVSFALQKTLGKPVYVMGDTAYESCCVDYVAAAHINADAIIHYGPVCFSKVENKIPCLYVFEKASVDVKHVYECLEKFCKGIDSSKRVALVVDTQYIFKIDELNALVNNNVPVEIIKANEVKTKENADVCVFLGQNNRKLMSIACIFNGKEIYYLDPQIAEISIISYTINAPILKRRYFLIEKIKDAKTVGIVVGTLAVQNYLQLIERIKTLCKLNGKKYYIISVGKPTVAKLANFPEIDVYAVISCANSEIYENRDFYKPIVTPYDIEVALNPKAETKQFSYDYNFYLNNNLELNLTESDIPENDISLLTGNVRLTNGKNSENNTDNHNSTALAVKDDGIIAVSSNFGAGYLAERTWKGLEQNLEESTVEKVAEGRKGIAQGYQNETF